MCPGESERAQLNALCLSLLFQQVKEFQNHNKEINAVRSKHSAHWRETIDTFRKEKDLAELDKVADLLRTSLLLDELDKLHDAVGDELVADRLVLGEHLAETVKEVDDLLLGVRVLDKVLERVDDVLADRAAHGARGQLNRAQLDLLADLLGLHRLDVLDDLLELAVKKGRADVRVRGANIAAELGHELLDLLVGLALVQPVVDKSDDSLADRALDVVGLSCERGRADRREKESDVDCLHV